MLFLKIVVEGLYMVITCIFFLVFALNFVVIYSTPKIINVSFCAYTFFLDQ